MKKILQSIVLLLGVLLLPVAAYAQDFFGDVNGDGVINITDVNNVIDVILAGGYDSNCDVNSDGQVNITDLNVIIELILNPSQDPPANENKWVDLGLPSGTIWATRNIGASAPEEYGSYFAWGETVPKNYYDWNTYKWSYYDSNGRLSFSKYSRGGYGGIVDNKTELDLEDDAAYVNWGSSWRMPTLEQLQELNEDCSWHWTVRNGVKGLLGAGPNGNTIFFPYAGVRVNESLCNAGRWGEYWSRTLDSRLSGCAYFLGFYDSYLFWPENYLDRFEGRPVRAVRVSQN